MIRILSLGAGVQSTTVALMAAHGEIPPLDAAIFADTQSEPQAVYDHLAKLMAPGVLPFPVHVVTRGSLRQEIFDAVANKVGAWACLPFYLINANDLSRGMLRRQCTQDYKIEPVYREVRRLAGIKRGSKGPKDVVVEKVLGISLDEAHRQRDARFRWVRHSYPLIELGLTRADCMEKLRAWGWTAPKSACTFCPYHDDATWAAMQVNDPTSFADAVAVDDAVRAGLPRVKGVAFLHRSRQPLKLVNFTKQPSQRSGFGNDCTGMCGV